MGLMAQPSNPQSVFFIEICQSVHILVQQHKCHSSESCFGKVQLQSWTVDCRLEHSPLFVKDILTLTSPTHIHPSTIDLKDVTCSCLLSGVLVSVIIPLVLTGCEEIPSYHDFTVRAGEQNPQSSFCVQLLLAFLANEVWVSQNYLIQNYFLVFCRTVSFISSSKDSKVMMLIMGARSKSLYPSKSPYIAALTVKRCFNHSLPL